MLVIRQEQLEVLAAAQDEPFARRLLGWLRRQRRSPLAAIDDAVLLSDIRAAMADARRLGLTWESTVAGYVRAALEADAPVPVDLAGAENPDEAMQRFLDGREP
jgi:hypothetical protein